MLEFSLLYCSSALRECRDTYILPLQNCLFQEKVKEGYGHEESRYRESEGCKGRLLIVAVDIGMEMNRGYCTTPDGRSTKTFKFDNPREGLDTLWGMIMTSKDRFKCNEVIVGYESTGPYGEPMVHYLLKKPVRVVQVNPIHTKR
jgi:transposase